MTVLAELISRQAREQPDKAVLEAARDDRSITYSQLAAATATWQTRLTSANLAAGARVGLQGRDPLLLAVAFIGVIAAGHCVAPIGPDADPAAMTRWRSDVQPSGLIETDKQGLDGTGPRFAISPGNHSPAGLMLSSSGTTGPAKLVALSEAQLLATAANVVSAHRLTADDRCLNSLPLWHINAEVVGVLATLTSGSTLVLDDRFRRTGFWEVVHSKQITWINAVPAVLAILARDEHDPAAGERHPASAVRFARSASAPLPPSIQRAFENLTGIGVVQTYGMTEAASQITAERLPHERQVTHSPGSVGRPVGVELRILGDGDLPVPVLVSGRIQIRGASVITEYASAAGAEHITADGWVDTGDVGFLDAEGELHLDGRRKDVINRGGEKFSPFHIEDALLGVSGVGELAIVGVEDDVLGQVPVAVVVPREDAEPGLAQRLQAESDKSLDRVRRPVRVHLVESLHNGVNGKISRAAVVQMLIELGLESPS